jgi:hypothetical protein
VKKLHRVAALPAKSFTVTGWFAVRTVLAKGKGACDCVAGDESAPHIQPQNNRWSRSLIQEISTLTERLQTPSSNDMESLNCSGISNKKFEGCDAAALESNWLSLGCIAIRR